MRLPMADFKEMVKEDFGVPVDQQRYWVWARRVNGTHRPARLLRQEEEEQRWGGLRPGRPRAWC